MFTGPNIVKDGLVLWLDAANTKSYPGSGTTWTDMSGNNRNFTLVNGPTYNSANGGSIVFDGTNDIATLNIASDNPMKIQNFIFANHTYEVWFNLSTLTPSLVDNTETSQAIITWPGYHNAIYVSRTSPSSSVTLTTNYLWNSTLTNAFSVTTDATNILRPNAWFCIHDIINYSATQSLAYINGTNLYVTGLVPTSSMTSAQGPFPNTITLGGASVTGNYKSLMQNGRIACVRLYNRALSPQEVQQNYNATKARFGL